MQVFLIAVADIAEVVRAAHYSVSNKVQINWLYSSLTLLEVVRSNRRNIEQDWWLLRLTTNTSMLKVSRLRIIGVIGSGKVKRKELKIFSGQIGSNRAKLFYHIVSVRVKPSKNNVESS